LEYSGRRRNGWKEVGEIMDKEFEKKDKRKLSNYVEGEGKN
jgi:hypothetical protein